MVATRPRSTSSSRTGRTSSSPRKISRRMIRHSGSSGRAKKTPDQRIGALLDDPLVHKPSLGSFRVSCLPCGKRLKLDTRGGRPFYSFNWIKHRNTKCFKAIEAQRRIKAGQPFEIASKWKSWTRDSLDKVDQREDDADRFYGRGLFTPVWRQKCLELGILKNSESGAQCPEPSPLPESPDVSSRMQSTGSDARLTDQELEVARILCNSRMLLLVNVAVAIDSKE
ncbi:hypothetical protein V5O48_007234 [Marasmius crinis-equi]|uniref:Uncharacterized protein n=1 Tax=Marasmius crinis-equi TaxID=585013 RepID=A0ABR3FH92_9AGAR